jgi:hypothetical protein
MVVTVHLLIHHGVQQLLQVKMLAVHIGTPAAVAAVCSVAVLSDKAVTAAAELLL